MCKDLIHQDASFMAEAIRNGHTNSRELISIHIDRYQNFNSKLNGIVTFAEDALEEASKADKELEDGLIKGPLHGVPFTMKDVFDSAGIRTTRGSKLFLDRIPESDSEVVKRLKNAGGILIGKTNLPEFALAAETSSAIFEKGENILIVDQNDKSLARGLSSFTSSEINKIKGKQSKEIENILGYLSKTEIVHKDDMVKL